MTQKTEQEYQPALLIMACPYCGSGCVHELNREEGPMVESVAVWCDSCDEEFDVNRNLDTEDTDSD